MGRVLAVDWGERRFGVAVSDPGRLIAQPLTTLHRRAGKRAPVKALLDLITSNDVDEIVVGLPLTPEGEEADSANAARELGEALAKRSARPVHYQDERLTTAQALRASRSVGVRDKDSRGKLDQMAAVGILQAWLDNQRQRGTEAQ